jgi:hypothetical protein
VAGKVVLLDHNHGQAAPGGITGDAGTVDAAADNQQIARQGRCSFLKKRTKKLLSIFGGTGVSWVG